MEGSSKPSSAKPVEAATQRIGRRKQHQTCTQICGRCSTILSDVVFNCQDTVQVHASRMLLTARSPVFSSILEAKAKEVSLPEILSTTLLSILDFLYTGSMIQHAPLSSVKAYEIISAAKYFQLRNVEELVREFLVNTTGDIADDMTQAALRLSMALEFGTSQSRSWVPRASLVRTLNSGQLEPIRLRGLSEKAFRYFIRRTKQSAISDPEAVSFGEYLLFSNIILWCLTQICPDEAPCVARWCLPNAKSAARLLRELQEVPEMAFSRSFREEASRDAGYLKSLLVRKPESAALVDSVLTLVDYRRIHPELLVAVVEPLQIASAAQVSGAYRFQALHHKSTRGRATGELFQWEHASSYGIKGDGRVITKVSNVVGFARFTVPIARPYGVYEWDIVIEELCVGFCEIGLHSVDEFQDGIKPNFTGETLAQQPTGWALSHVHKTGTRISQRGECRGGGWKDFTKDFAHAIARIRVHLDMFERSCSFSVDGDEFLVAWMNLPQGVYFPALSLGEGRRGRVRIELVNGFDML